MRQLEIAYIIGGYPFIKDQIHYGFTTHDKQSIMLLFRNKKMGANCIYYFKHIVQIDRKSNVFNTLRGHNEV